MAVACLIIGGGGHIHIFVFTDHKKHRFQKKLIFSEHEYMNMNPTPNYRACYGHETL